MSEWETEEESGQKWLDALGGTFWISEGAANTYSLVKVTVDYAGPNFSKELRFATELRAKDWVEYLIKEEGVVHKDPVITYPV